MVPIPDEPPCTSSVSPTASLPRSNTLCQTVKNVSGIAAASTIDRLAGAGSAWLAESQAIFGVAAADYERHHFVVLVPARHTRANVGDLAGDFQAGNFGRAFRRRIVTLPLHHVRSVHARGGDSHQNFAFTRQRHRPFPPHKHVGSARLADRNKSHRFGQTTVLHKRSLQIGDRINLSAADVTTGIEAAKNHFMQE